MLINQSGLILVELWNVKSISLQGSFQGVIICRQSLASHGRAICYRVGSNRLSSRLSDPCRALYQHGINHDHYCSACNLTITLTCLLLIFNREPLCCTLSSWLAFPSHALSNPLAFTTPYPLCCVSFMPCDSYLSVIWLPPSAFPARGSLCLGACSAWSDKRWIIPFQTTLWGRIGAGSGITPFLSKWKGVRVCNNRGWAKR